MNKSNRVHARAISLENDTNEGDLAKNVSVTIEFLGPPVCL